MDVCRCRKKKWYILILAILQVFYDGIGALFALVLRNVVDTAAAHNSQGFWHNVILGILVVLADLGIGALLRWLNELSRSGLENVFKQRLVDNVLRREYAAVSAIHTAEWLNRITSDTTVVANGIVEILPGLVGTVVRLVCALVMIIALDPWFVYILIPGGILMVLLTYAFRKVLKRLHKNIQESDGRLRIFLQERISNLMVIKSFAAENRASVQAAQKMADHKEARMKRNRFSNIANLGFSGAMEGMYLLGIVYCAYGILSGTVTYGTLAAIMQLVGQVQAPFANISGYLPRWYAMTASAERLMEVETYVQDPPVYPADEVLSYYRDRFSCFGLEDASFTYAGEKSHAVIHHVDLRINKGQYVAITGRSGCGKTTLLKLLLGMYPLDSGKCFLDGRSLSASWRRLFAYVPQGNALMAGSVREVISFAQPQAAQEEARIRQAIRIACADEFLDDLDIVLGERGSGFSEGQMQRLAIARAIFSGAPVLLLDEATSALDEETELQLLNNLRAMTDCTVLIVTHRKAVLAICDMELAFEENKIQSRMIDHTRKAEI